MQWCESFLFGRSANLAVHRLGKRALAKGGRAACKFDDELRSSLRFLQLQVAGNSAAIVSGHKRSLISFH